MNKKNEIKLSIIIPVYNVEQYVIKALNSIKNQRNISLKNCQILIIDDGSKDDSFNIIRNWIKYNNLSSNQFKLISKNNGNWGSVINYVKNNNLIKGKYVSILDADDFFELDCFQNIFKIIDLNRYDLIISNFYRVNDLNKKKKTNVIYSNTSKEIQKKKSFTPWSIPICKFFKKEIFLNLSKLEEGVSYQDQILFFSFLIRSNKIYFVKKNLGNYYISRPESSTQAKWNKQRINLWCNNMNKLLSFNSNEINAYVMMMVDYCYRNINKSDKKYIRINYKNINLLYKSKFSFLPFYLSWIAKIWFILVNKKFIF